MKNCEECDELSKMNPERKLQQSDNTTVYTSKLGWSSQCFLSKSFKSWNLTDRLNPYCISTFSFHLIVTNLSLAETLRVSPTIWLVVTSPQSSPPEPGEDPVIISLTALLIIKHPHLTSVITDLFTIVIFTNTKYCQALFPFLSCLGQDT